MTQPEGVPAGAGLCASCAHVRVVVSGRGSRFVLCRRSADDQRFPRYPPLPVVECSGHELPQDADESTSPGGY